MTFKEYFNLTKETTQSCLKICSIVFSSIFVLTAIILLNITDSFIAAANIFSIIFLAGNGIALLIWFLAITSAYSEANRVSKFFNSIPEPIKKRFNLSLEAKSLNPKYNYLKFEFVNSNKEEHFLFNFSKELVWITLLIDLNDVDNLPALIVDINNSYRSETIELSAWGLRQKIKWKEWETVNEEKINAIFERLTAISHKENLKVTTKDLKDTDIFELVSA